MFRSADAFLLHSIIREYNPKHIIEIGSGYSTAVMLDANEYYMGGQIDITCIEPYPERLFSILKDGDDKILSLRKDFVQNIILDEFDNLEENDILFIDSSHVAKMGGDVPYEYFNILPRLKKGVIIHIHDIFYPFTYPDKWIVGGRAYNEAFILRALLMNNNAYKMIFFNNMIYQLCSDRYRAIFNRCNLAEGVGSSIWLKKE